MGATALTLTGAAVVATTTTGASASSTEPSARVAAVAPAAVAAPTAAQVKAATIARYGVYPLPVSVAQIKKYKLGKKGLKQIVAARKLAKTSHVRSIRQCESGGNYRSIDHPYYGAYQFDRGTWQSNGGGRYAPTANKAPKFAQDHIMYKTYKARGWSPWSCA